MRLLQLVCDDEPLARWCLDHGASVHDEHPDPYRSPPLLEVAASVGSVATFNLLRSRGAQLGRRTLHCAVRGAARSRDEPEQRLARMAMVKYLVDEVGLDVNALDTDSRMPNFWGTPLCYAVITGSDSEEVIRFLLARGADPLIKNCWGFHNALNMAESSKNHRLMELLGEATSDYQKAA